MQMSQYFTVQIQGAPSDSSIPKTIKFTAEEPAEYSIVMQMLQEQCGRGLLRHSNSTEVAPKEQLRAGGKFIYILHAGKQLHT